jgi:hypothetical protein
MGMHKIVEKMGKYYPNNWGKKLTLEKCLTMTSN